MHIDIFHSWLSHNLRTRLAEIRRSFSDRLPTAGELDRIALLEMLLNDVSNVSEHLFVLFQMMMSIDRLAESFDRKSHDLLQKVGVECVPRDASDLVRCLLKQAVQPGGAQQPRTRQSPLPWFRAQTSSPANGPPRTSHRAPAR